MNLFKNEYYYYNLYIKQLHVTNFQHFFSLQNIYAPDPDPELIIQLYDRTFEQNEDLGLNDMKTENYLEDEETALQQQEGKPLQFRPGATKTKACCAKSKMIMDISQGSGKHLITRDTPGGGGNGTSQTSPNLNQSSTRKSSATNQSTSKYPSSPAMTGTRSVTPSDQAGKQ